METIEMEVGAEKREGRGRQLRATDEWRGLVERYERSGLTQRAFAQSEGLKYTTFVAWLGRVRRRRTFSGEPGVRFATVRLPAPVSSSGETSAGTTLEVVLRDGLIVRGRDAREVAGLVRALTS
ncbi:MAG: hypothetical protein J6386_08105 [Candidatus Synoicihabitans palmerolidicus]|nr:hypothetical protein [Candidatus Synoicihabitans palmerolidicus]